MAFQRNPNAAPATPTKPAAAPARSRYGGISCAQTRDPMLAPGRYRLRVLGASEGYNPKRGTTSCKVSTVVLACDGEGATPVGAQVAQIYGATPAGVSETKRWAMHSAGYGATLAQIDAGQAKDAELQGEADFDAVDESFGYQGAIIESTMGKSDKAPSLAGRIVDVIVTRGKDVPREDGSPSVDYFREYRWAAVPDEEQDSPA